MSQKAGMIPTKLKTCRCGCKQKFTPRSSFQTAAFPECALRLVEKKKIKDQAIRDKRERAEIRERKLESKRIEYWLNRAQVAVNALRRYLDKDKPCFTCQTWDADEWHAGHWLSRGACSSLRFDWQRNIRTTCNRCNIHLGGNAAIFRVELVKELGEEMVQDMENTPRSRRWTREECQQIEADAKARLKALKSTNQ